jgi:hypothetical protein
MVTMNRSVSIVVSQWWLDSVTSVDPRLKWALPFRACWRPPYGTSIRSIVQKNVAQNWWHERKHGFHFCQHIHSSLYATAYLDAQYNSFKVHISKNAYWLTSGHFLSVFLPAISRGIGFYSPSLTWCLTWWKKQGIFIPCSVVFK